MKCDELIIKSLCEAYKHKTCLRYQQLAKSGSHRLYFRFFFENNETIIGAFNEDIDENEAFFSFSSFFYSQHIHVPQVLDIHPSRCYYLLTDLGDTTLFSYLSQHRNGNDIPENVLRYYQKVIQQLPLIQLCGKKGIDFSIAYPRAAFDRQSMQWDLNYFKYYYLKLVGIVFNEQKLEDDFQTLMDYLCETDSSYFLFRDFQSRNIMLRKDEVYFIDYQGGRRGALQYDIASLLYDGKAAISPATRDFLLSCYIGELEKYIAVDRTDFVNRFNAFVLIRIMQSMGTYGYRGYFEKKSHFIQSIPFAIKNIRHLLSQVILPISIDYLLSVLQAVVDKGVVAFEEEADTVVVSDWQELTVSIKSFSYKKGIPCESPNGGGFVFDCRFLPNPGREPYYRQYNGKDREVKEYLEKYDAVAMFKTNYRAVVDAAVNNYLERHFTDLSVCFGCTGGQHRSVYFAEDLAQHLQNRYPSVKVVINHSEIK